MLLTNEMEEVFIIDGETADEVEKQLQKAMADIKELSVDELDAKVQKENFGAGRVTPFTESVDFALVINGCSLVSSTLYNHLFLIC